MGFLDKMKATAKDLGKAAKDVKGELEKSGLLDAVKQSSQTTTTDSGSETFYSPNDNQQHDQEEPWDIHTLIKQRTGVDPGAILSTEEVTRLTGIEVTADQYVGGAENFTGRTWRGKFKKDDYSFEVSILHDYIGDRTDELGLDEDGGRTRMEETRLNFDNIVDVPGVGDEAFVDEGGYLFARRGRWTIMVSATTPASYDATSACKNLAIQALNNLPA